MVAGISRRAAFVVSFNSVNMGLVDEVDPSGLKFELEGIFTGSTGKKNKLGDRVVGVGGTIKIQFRQLSLVMYQALAPWNAGAVPIALIPPLNTDLYTFSLPLLLHPDDLGAVTTEDITFPHACPIRLPLPKRGGDKDDVLEIEFAIYPDRAAFNTSFGAMSVAGVKGT